MFKYFEEDSDLVVGQRSVPVLQKIISNCYAINHDCFTVSVDSAHYCEKVFIIFLFAFRVGQGALIVTYALLWAQTDLFTKKV